MKKWLLIAMFSGLSCASIPSHAQQCGYGTQDGSQCVPADQVPGYQDSLQDRQARPQQPQVFWASRYGAVAYDSVSGAEGHITDQPSKSQAKKEVLRLCVQHGGTNCKILISYYNQCAAIAQVQGGGRIGTGNALHSQQAEQLAMEACQKGGAPNCKIVYTACSLPVRIQ